MKELSIEEKAKAYDEAKARMSRAFNSNRCTIGFMNEIFPELKESEDEKIRKGLIKALSSIGKRNWGGIDVFESIAWLEKQDTDIEYTRTDAFIAKACDWLEDNIDRYLYNTGGYGEYIPKCGGKMYEDFKKAMEE